MKLSTNYELYKKAMEFAKKKNSKHEGLSNLYVIQKTDREGNITGEYYGMNVMTDHGMSKYFVDNQNFPTNIYIGNGTGTFNHTTESLISAVTTEASKTSNTNKSYAFPLYYDEYSGLITCTCQYLVAYFDYDINGITDTIAITEYGIGTAYNALWTHSWVYDTTGAQTYINKSVNDRLTITVFLCFSYYESLITEGYAEGKYTVITSMEKFFNRMYESEIYTYKRGNTGCTRSRNNTSTGFINNEITRYTNLNTFTMYSGTDTNAGYIDGFCQWYNGFITLEPQMLDTPEDFDITMRMDYGNNTSIGLADKFGMCTEAMFTQADISGVYLYDHKTGAFDNSEEFYNPSERWYSETPMTTYFATKIYYTNNNTIIPMYVYQNIRTDDDILSINSALSVVYATDKYWDTSSWIHISNLEEIPVEARNCRYWITPSNTVSINPVRKSGNFKLLPTNGDSETYSWATIKNGSYPVCDNYEYGWYMVDNVVHVPANELTFTIGASGVTASTSMTYKKWLVTFTSSTNYLLTDMSDLSVAPTPTTTTPLFTTATNCLTKCYRTNSDTGIICLQSLSANESNIIDLRNDGFNQILFNSTMAVAVWGVNQIAYIPSDDTSKVLVYDFDINGTIREFTIPEGVVTVRFMVAHRDFIWISDGSTYSYVMDIRDGSIVGCENTITYNDHLQNVEFTAVDDVLIMYYFSGYDISTSYYLRYDNPTVPENLSSFDFDPGYTGARSTYTLRYIHGKTLVLSISMLRRHSYAGAYNLVIDFGRFLNDGTVENNYAHRGADSTTVLVPYGEFFINGNKKTPIEYWLYHRIVGKTKTITTQNFIKNISGKQWAVTITNIPEFTGLPPGEVQ